MKVVEQATSATLAVADRGRVEMEEGDRRFGVAWVGPCCSGEPQIRGASRTGESAVGGHFGAGSARRDKKVTVFTCSSDLLTPSRERGGSQ